MIWLILGAVGLALACKVGSDARSHQRRMRAERLDFERYVQMAHEERPRL